MAEEKPVKVNKWDGSSVKNALDDAVNLYVKEKLHYDVKHLLFDIRLAVSFIAVSFAGFALLWDWLHPFPKSRPVLIICVIAYFIVMAVLQVYMWLIEGKTFLQAVDRDPTGTKPDRIFTFGSAMKKYDHIYQLEVAVSSKGFKAETALNKSVASWYDEEGNLVMDVFNNDVQKLLDSLAADKKKK